MLKVLINEEEVLTNKDFTIKKEMLNTPSVILNNVYPKTWEDTKDYTSNFYHPQDYSKCKIIDETIIPAEPGETISGTSFTIQNNDNTKINELTEIDGNTTQASTPTPSSPQPINVVSGRQEVSVVGKNLFDINNATTSNTSYTFENDILSVQATGGNYNRIQLNATEVETIIKNNAGKTLKFRFDNLDLSQFDSANDVIIQLTFSINGTNSYNRILERNTSSPTGYKITNFVIPNDTSGMSNFRLQIYANNSATSTSTSKVVITKPMFYFGEDSSYEEYKGQSYEINLGKNLLDLVLTSGTLNQVDYTNNNGTITLNGTASANGLITSHSSSTGILLQAGTYTLSANNSVAESNNTYIRLCTLNGTAISGTGVYLGTANNKITFTLTSDTKVRFQIRIGNGITYDNYVIKPQLEKGSSASSFSPYKTPIELCKINTYKDRIYKENGTWYLHKEIGKVVLNGSEEYIYQNNTFRINVSNLTSIGDSEIREISNYYQAIPYNASWGNYDYFVSNTKGYPTRIVIKNKDITSTNDFKTWLSTHNTIVYYVLATPTTTEITDTELISQLNAIELLEGLNNVSVSSGDLPGKITIHYNYTEEQTIDDLLFCGVVKNSGNISLNPREPHYLNIQILDFKTFLSEGELDSFVIYQKTILEAIQMVIANIQDYGFILGNINILNPTDIIGAYSTKDKTAYDVFNYIADITQSRWTTRLIDENHVAIDFYDPTLMIEGTPINYTQTFFEDNLIDDMTYSYGSNNYRNKQVMTSSQVYSNISQQQSIVANGYQTQFPTEQPIGKINSITSNGIPLTFATFNEKDMGYVADFYYSPGDNYFESEDLRTTGEILIIDYVAIVEGRQIITNPLEIDRINESTGRKGIISRYEQRNDATTSTELQKIGESYIKYKGTPEIKLKISTRKNIWEVGQRVQFNAPIEELDIEYMVRTKKINYISTIDTIFYEYELISSFNSETEINYFDNQRAKASGNIGEGEYISRNIDIESTANIIFYDTETTEVQVDGDNELNAILNSPFTS